MQTHCFSGGYGRRRAPAGFTLIELMIVVAIMTVVAGLAIRVMSRASRGERAPAFARSVLAMVHHARQQALISNRPTKILVYSNASSSTIESWKLEADGTTWTKLDGSEPTSHSIDVCDAQGGRPNPLGAWPTSGLNCPTTATSTTPITIYFSKSLCTYPAFNCVSGSTSTGSIIYLQTHDGTKHYRIPIWGLTGLPALVDQ